MTKGVDLQQLLRTHREDILKIASRHGAYNVRIFGSAARGEARPDSDIDVLVEFEPGHSLLDRISLMRELEELLGQKVDVVTEQALHHYIRDEVLQQAISL